jgi:hypothetical protein
MHDHGRYCRVVPRGQPKYRQSRRSQLALVPTSTLASTRSTAPSWPAKGRFNGLGGAQRTDRLGGLLHEYRIAPELVLNPDEVRAPRSNWPWSCENSAGKHRSRRSTGRPRSMTLIACFPGRQNRGLAGFKMAHRANVTAHVFKPCSSGTSVPGLSTVKKRGGAEQSPPAGHGAQGH